MIIYNKEEAKNIPILEVAKLVVPKFIDRGNNSTGQCIMHTDNKLGNLRFRAEPQYNYAHCFTCHETWDSIGLVMSFTNRSFPDALEFLYQSFPSYFTEIKTIKKQPKWNGLTNKEYKFLNIPLQMVCKNGNLNIRDFAIEFPEEHDLILLQSVQAKIKEINEIEQNIQKYLPREYLQKEKKDIYKYLYLLVNKGLMTDTYKENLNFLVTN